MDWLTNNWIWIGLALVVLYFYFRSSGSTATRTNPINDEATKAIVMALIGAFEHILQNFLGDHYSRDEITKIAVGMVAVMADEKISLDQMKRNPDLVIAVAAKSAAALTRAGIIHPIDA